MDSIFCSTAPTKRGRDSKSDQGRLEWSTLALGRLHDQDRAGAGRVSDASLCAWPGCGRYLLLTTASVNNSISPQFDYNLTIPKYRRSSIPSRVSVLRSHSRITGG